jgi:hypothetical protein
MVSQPLLVDKPLLVNKSLLVLELLEPEPIITKSQLTPETLEMP